MTAKEANEAEKTLAELLGVKVPAVNKHLKTIFDAGELAEMDAGADPVFLFVHKDNPREKVRDGGFRCTKLNLGLLFERAAQDPRGKAQLGPTL